MRQPTPDAKAYVWWRAVIAGDPVSYHLNEIHAGFFKTRLTYRGPWWPARIWIVSEVDADGMLTGEERFACHVAGEAADALEQWPYLAKRPVPLAEYQQLCEERGVYD